MNILSKTIFKLYTYYKYKPTKEAKNLFRNITENQESYIENRTNKYKKILFCPFNPSQLNLYRESVWGYACKLRGAEVKLLSYDLSLEAIDFINPKTKKDLNTIYKVNKKIFKHIDLPVLYFSQYYKHIDTTDKIENLTSSQIESYTYKDILLGDLVTASTVRYFYSVGAEWENPSFLSKAKQFLKTAIILVDIYESVIKEEKPDKIVTSHGIYVSWGTLYRVARKMDIPIDVYGASYRKNTLRFYHNSPNAPFPDAHWPEYSKYSLSNTEHETVDEYFKTRENQSEDNISLFDSSSSLPESLKNFVKTNKEKGKKVFCLFANIAWDAYLFKKDNKSFGSMIEWIKHTINLFQKLDNACLIVKSHPAENHFNVPKEYRVSSYIPDDLSDNIIFLDENSNVKPFYIYPEIDYGIVYISTVLLEMAIKNIPVITAGVGGHYSNKGFSIDPTSIENYTEYIKDAAIGKLDAQIDKDLAKKYLYYRFFNEALKIEFFNLKGYQIESFNIKSIKELLPNKCRELDIICEGILNDEKFLNSIK